MARTLRIAFVGQKGFPASWGGVEAHVDAIAPRLAARGHEVTVYVRRWYSPQEDERVRGVRRVMMPTIRGKHIDAALHSALSAAHAAVTGFDIVHFHAMGPALFAPLPRLLGRAVVTTLHGDDYLRDKWGSVAKQALRLGEAAALRFSQQVVVVSRQAQRAYRDAGIEVTYIPNGVNVPASASRSRGGRPYLLSLGRWVPEKRVRELVEAFVELDPDGLDFVVAGDTDDLAYRGAVREAAADHPGVHFPGFVTGTAKDELFAGARGFITASALEGLPVALLEALAAGLPCAASAIEPHREVVGGLCEEGLFDVDSPQTGLRWLSSFVDSENDRDRRVEQITSTYSWERHCDRLEEVYGSALV